MAGELVIGDGEPVRTIGDLATRLVALEERLLAERPDAVVLVGTGDEALAGALVAGKLLIPIRTRETDRGHADPAQEANRRVIDLLSSPPR